MPRWGERIKSLEAMLDQQERQNTTRGAARPTSNVSSNQTKPLTSESPRGDRE